MGYMLERQWEAYTRLQDGFSRIVFEDGEEITVKNDGKTGIDFVEEYLDEMKKNYPSHLVAADQLLQMRLGRSYKTIRNLRSRYLSELALVSLNCCFGREDDIPDHEGPEDFNTEHTHCPMRYNCPFNGFNPAFKDKGGVLQSGVRVRTDSHSGCCGEHAGKYFAHLRRDCRRNGMQLFQYRQHAETYFCEVGCGYTS